MYHFRGVIAAYEVKYTATRSARRTIKYLPRPDTKSKWQTLLTGETTRPAKFIRRWFSLHSRSVPIIHRPSLPRFLLTIATFIKFPRADRHPLWRACFTKLNALWRSHCQTVSLSDISSDSFEFRGYFRRSASRRGLKPLNMEEFREETERAYRKLIVWTYFNKCRILVIVSQISSENYILT